MKKVILFLAGILLATTSFAQTPVAWYPMQGNANDSTGNGHNGTLMNNPVLTADENSNPNSAYSFNGSNQYIKVSYDPAFNIVPSGQFTISLWLYADTTNNKARALFVKSPTNTAWDYGLYLFTNNKIMLGHNGVHICWSKTQILQKQWYCVVGTYNNGDWKIYINGQLDSAVINSGKYITQSAGGLAIAVKGESLIDYFAGTLDNVMFYNVALSDTQIAAMSCNSSQLAPPPVSNFASSDSAFCGGHCISYTDLSTGNPTSWLWTFPGATPSSSTDQNPQNICYADSGVYDVKLITGNSAGIDSITLNNYIHVFPLPSPPVLIQSNDTLFCLPDTNYISYQWYSDTTLMSGDTSAFLVITSAGNYTISVQNQYGCGITTSISGFLIPPPISNFTSSDSGFCLGTCINFSDLSTGNPTSWQWSFPGAVIPSSTEQNPQNICYTHSGYYDVTLITGNSGGSDSLTISNYINVFPLPPAPVITLSGDTLFCRTDSNYVSYQWYSDTTLIIGNTVSFLVIDSSGNYNISVRNQNGCEIAAGTNVILGTPPFIRQGRIAIYPNPATDKLHVVGFATREESVLIIYDVVGKAILSHHFSFTETQEETIDISALSKGIYIIEVSSANKSFRTKVLVE